MLGTRVNGVTYEARFHFINETKDKEMNDTFLIGDWWVVQELTQRNFFTMRSELIDYLNPQYEKWNKEYDEKYGVGHMEVGSDKFNHYNGWIIKKSQPYVNKVNKKYGFKKGFGLYLNPDEDGDIEFKRKLPNGDVMRCFVTLHEM